VRKRVAAVAVGCRQAQSPGAEVLGLVRRTTCDSGYPPKDWAVEGSLPQGCAFTGPRNSRSPAPGGRRSAIHPANGLLSTVQNPVPWFSEPWGAQAHDL